MPVHDIIVIGASAGGISALSRLFQALPAGLPAAIAVVQHTSANSPGLVDRIIARDCRLPTRYAVDRMPLELGTIAFAPPDHHLLIEPGGMRVVRGPRENLHRPSIDPLFRSAAGIYGPRVLGVVLTGSLDDGTAGLQAIRGAGGVTAVQDPDEAEFPSMPRSALAAVPIDHCLPLAGLADLLVRLAGEPDAPGTLQVHNDLVREAAMAAGGHTDPAILDGLGRPSYFSCPECHGILWELDDEAILRYRCHVGHAFTAETLHKGQVNEQERALWIALRTLEEQTALFTRMAGRAQARDQTTVASRFRQRVEEYAHDARILRAMLRREDPPGPAVAQPSLSGN
jgi:two-component system chemotaxis response regulator CheB